MWQWTPFVALVLLYGLLTVPTDVLEAAKIDGASSFQILKNVSLPSIRPFILTILLLRTMDCFKVFDIVFPLTYGGPGLSTTTLSFNIYLNAFAILDIGTSSAMAVIMLAIITILAQMYIRIVYRGEKI
jgi:multiple sugar transport system permease protein